MQRVAPCSKNAQRSPTMSQVFEQLSVYTAKSPDSAQHKARMLHPKNVQPVIYRGGRTFIVQRNGKLHEIRK